MPSILPSIPFPPSLLFPPISYIPQFNLFHDFGHRSANYPHCLLSSNYSSFMLAISFPPPSIPFAHTFFTPSIHPFLLLSFLPFILPNFLLLLPSSHPFEIKPSIPVGLFPHSIPTLYHPSIHSPMLPSVHLPSKLFPFLPTFHYSILAFHVSFPKSVNLTRVCLLLADPAYNYKKLSIAQQVLLSKL